MVRQRLENNEFGRIRRRLGDGWIWWEPVVSGLMMIASSGARMRAGRVRMRVGGASSSCGGMSVNSGV
jgi:hypothetical protein